MSTEARDRAGALVVSPKSGDAVTVRGDTALARARAALNPTAPIPVLHVPITCARVGLTYLATGRREGDTLAVSSAAPIAKGRGTASEAADGGAGFFSTIAFPAGWRCPGCRRPHSGATWACDCARRAGALHTCGDVDRAGLCACGKSEVLHFKETDGVDVRGSVSMPRAALRSSTAPRSVPALPASVPHLLLPGKLK